MDAPNPSRPGSPRTTRILVVDDHPMTRKGLVELLHTQYRPLVCQECDSVKSALPHLSQSWDLAIFDHRLSDGTGIELVEAAGKTPSILFTMYEDPILAKEARSRGAKGYISKVAHPSEIMDGIRKVLLGVPHFPILASSPASQPLSGRESAVLDGLLEGKGSQEIATELRVSHSSIQTYKSRIFRKLGVDNLAQLLRTAAARRSP